VSPVLTVFFPSLMGIGILVSGGLLVADMFRKHIPQNDLRRRHGIAVATHQIVGRAAAWTGKSVSADDLLERAPRRSATYVSWALVSVIVGVAVPVTAAAAYRDQLGVFYESPWMVGLGIAGAAVGALAAVLILGVCFPQARSHSPIRWLVAHTVLGRLQVSELSFPSFDALERGVDPWQES